VDFTAISRLQYDLTNSPEKTNACFLCTYNVGESREQLAFCANGSTICADVVDAQRGTPFSPTNNEG
jgi:hypothetical protein